MSGELQFIRQYSLLVSGSNIGIDLSALKFSFRTFAPDVQTPNTAVITVYNPAPSTVQQVQTEATQVILQAGYQGSDYGQIFAGEIKWIEKGRLDNKTTFMRLYCADGDTAYNNSVVNQTLASASSDPQSIASAIGTSFSKNGVQQGDTSALGATGGILPRGKVLFGMARAAARSLGRNNSVQWSIQNGKLVWVPLKGYAPGEAVVLTSKTGMVGVPTATQNGILVRCLINPKIQVGGLVKIDNNSINQTQIKSQGFPDYTSINFFASTSNDGTYKVLMNEISGDTRGNEWYCDLTCIAVDVSASSVNPYVGG